MNLKDEIRSGYLVKADMKKVWYIQMSILREVLDICNRHNLKIFADGGTLIGAVRHGGYIPWDDDIDMGMPREDYDRFCEIAPKELPAPYHVCSVYNDRYYTERFIKVVDSSTKAIPAGEKETPQNTSGIFVDIFPYDSMPNTPRRLARLVRKARHKQTLLKIAFKALNWLPRPIYDCLRIDRRIFSDYESLLRSFAAPENRYMTKIALHLKEYLYDREWLDNIEWVDFEDIRMPIPRGYNDVLTLNYGDYMTPKQVPSGHAVCRYVIPADRLPKD